MDKTTVIYKIGENTVALPATVTLHDSYQQLLEHLKQEKDVIRHLPFPVFVISTVLPAPQKSSRRGTRNLDVEGRRQAVIKDLGTQLTTIHDMMLRTERLESREKKCLFISPGSICIWSISLVRYLEWMAQLCHLYIRYIQDLEANQVIEIYRSTLENGPILEEKVIQTQVFFQNREAFLYRNCWGRRAMKEREQI